MPKVLTPKATAFFRVANSADVAIDADNQTLRGVRLMDVGATATFKGADGKSKSVLITPEHISALLAHAGNRALPIHETHEWFDAQDKPNADSVERAARIGALCKFRRDDSGNLIADAIFKNGEVWSDMLFAATHNPEDTQFSAVFNYAPDDAKCLPLNFRCADVVPNGAAVTALFSEADSTSNQTMDINELIQALADPKVQDAVSAIIKSHKKDATPADDAPNEAPAAEMESAAGVTDADKKKEDDAKPALMRAALRCERARNRVFAADKVALLAEVKTTAKAEATALLGKGGFMSNVGEETAKTGEDYITAAISAGAPNRATAIARMAKDKPELYATFR